MEQEVETSGSDAFECAVNALVEDNNRLIHIFTAYNPRVPRPRPERASTLLNCETNGANVLLETFATTVKKLGPGMLSHQTLGRFQASGANLLILLDELFLDPTLSSALIRTINTEGRLVNFLKGASKTEDGLSSEVYDSRIDLLIDALKNDFRDILGAIAAFETRQRSAAATDTKPVPGKHSRLRKFSAQAEREIVEFVECPEFDTGRERCGRTCYDVARAAHAWAQLKHPRTMPRDADSFKKAYRSIRDRCRRKG